MILTWPVAVALASAALNGVIGALAYVRSRGQSLYHSFALISLSFSFWSLAYVRAWPEFDDPFWMRVLFTPLAWLPGAGLSFAWVFTGLPQGERRLRTAPLYAAGAVLLILLWSGRISLGQFRLAFIAGGVPVFGVCLALLYRHWREAQDAAEANRRGYLFAAYLIAVSGGFTDFLPALLGSPFLTMANLSLMAYSVIVLNAIEKHYLLDLRTAAGQALALVAASTVLGLFLTGLAWLTRQVDGQLFVNFFVVSLALVLVLPPLWLRFNRAFNLLLFRQQAKRERALEEAERLLEGATSLARIEEAAVAAVSSVWGAGVELLWEPGELRGLDPARTLPRGLSEALARDPQVFTSAGLRREKGLRARRLLDALDERGANAVVPVLRDKEFVGAALLRAGQGYYDLSALRWLRRLGLLLGRAVRGAELAAEVIHADRLAQLGTLAAGIAHEVRNPLSAIRGAVELLGEPLPAERRREYLGILKEEVERLDGIVAELLDYAAPGTKQARCEWREVFDRVERLLGPDMPFGVELVSEGEPAELAVSGAHLQQILLNLVKNALQALAGAGGKGSIRVQVSRGRRQAVLEVADDGPGIPPELLPKLFTPFQSASPGGTGLGLAAVRRLAELYGGRAWAQNLSSGARFVVELPNAEGGRS